MEYSFASDEWIEAFKNAINASEQYKQSAANWEAGAICLAVKAKPDSGLSEDRYLFLDLYKGECRDARLVSADEASESSFMISAKYDKWKKILSGQLDPMTAMMMGQISIKGDLGTLMKHAQAAKDLIRCGAQVPTTFIED